MSFHNPKSSADVDHRFDFHPSTTAEKRGEHGSVREACKALAHQLDRDIPPGREKSLALTKLEEVMFWANAGIARAPEPDPPPCNTRPPSDLHKRSTRTQASDLRKRTPLGAPPLRGPRPLRPMLLKMFCTVPQVSELRPLAGPMLGDRGPTLLGARGGQITGGETTKSQFIRIES